MDIAANDLPDTLEAAHALLLAERAKAAAADARHRDATQLLEAQRLELERLQAEQRELEAQVAEIQARNQRYEHILATLKRLQFGRSSERLDKDQLNLAFEELVQGLAEIEQAEERADPALKTHRARERRDKRPSLPDHLAEVEVVLEPEQSVCPCCSGALHRIGEDVSRRLDVVPAQYQVIVTRRPKYACRACEGTIVQAPAPARLTEGGLPTERLVASVNYLLLMEPRQKVYQTLWCFNFAYVGQKLKQSPGLFLPVSLQRTKISPVLAETILRKDKWPSRARLRDRRGEPQYSTRSTHNYSSIQGQEVSCRLQGSNGISLRTRILLEAAIKDTIPNAAIGRASRPKRINSSLS